jgi:superoxide dismutase
VLHTMYWENMSPDGGGEPDGVLGTAIAEHFGSFAQFKAQFTQVVVSVQGSGWGLLTYEPLGTSPPSSAVCRCSPSTHGNMPTTSSTRTAEPSTRTPSGTS